MNSNFRNFLVWVAILFGLLLLFQAFQSSSGTTSRATEISYNELIQNIDTGQIQTAIIRGDEVSGNLSSGGSYVSKLPESHNIHDRMAEKKY